MRVYIQHRDDYYLVETLERISLLLLSNSDCRIRISTEDSDNGSFDLVEGVDEATARRGMEQLLRLTGDQGEGSAAISWDGTQFIKRVL